MVAVQNLLMYMATWEAIYQAARMVIYGIYTESSCTGDWVAIRKRLINEGPSYFNAFLHAIVVTTLGIYTAYALLFAPTEIQMRIPTETVSAPDLAFRDAAVLTESINLVFLSWLCYDVIHLVLNFPTLGGADTLAHHFAFMGASVLCSVYRIFPFSFSWLVAMEISSPWLNVRWYLLTTGRKGSKWLDYTNQAFGYSFILARVLMYGVGLVHLWANHGLLLLGKQAVPAAPIYVILTLVTAGYGLQLFWLKKILSMSKKKPKKDE